MDMAEEQWKTTSEPHGPHTTSIIEYKHHGIIGNGTGPSPIRIWWIWLNLEHWFFLWNVGEYSTAMHFVFTLVKHMSNQTCFGQHMKCLQEVRHGNSALRNKKPTLIRPAWRGLWWFNDAVPSVSKACFLYGSFLNYETHDSLHSACVLESKNCPVFVRGNCGHEGCK